MNQKIHDASAKLIAGINSQIAYMVEEERFEELNNWLFENEYEIFADNLEEVVALFHKDKEISRSEY
jgi:hypothetical protein